MIVGYNQSVPNDFMSPTKKLGDGIIDFTKSQLCAFRINYAALCFLAGNWNCKIVKWTSASYIKDVEGHDWTLAALELKLLPSETRQGYRDSDIMNSASPIISQIQTDTLRKKQAYF